MGIEVTLRRGDGQRLTHLPDPNGGTFDAAGDFDALLGSAGLPVLGSIDPFGDTVLIAQHMTALIADVDEALDQVTAGPPTRGLRRLRAMAEMCRVDESLALHITGD